MIMQQQQNSPVFLVLALSLASILFTSTLIELSKDFKTRAYRPDAARMDPPSYVIEDFPERLSLPLAKVAMAVEESVHYDIESKASSYEWDELNPGGKASIRIGPEYHAAALPMSHQLHCIGNFKSELRDSSSRSYGWEHVEHCTNIMRQWALCRADLTLESGDFMQRDFDWDRKGATHECLDWQDVYGALVSDWEAWTSLWKKHHLGRHLYQPVNILDLINADK
ncbi:hypothetical protein BJ912DRAFT_1048458 [Pholiota molesta]|nr:hypothetical protein BJ912DRAFT_1048458 [Pholiota molesta]